MPTLDEIHAAIDKWFAETCQGGPLSQSTPAYNQVFAAREDLKQRFAELMGPVLQAVIDPQAEPETPAEPQQSAADAAPEQE